MSSKKIQILGSFSDHISVDDTLAQSGKAADAKATGDAINQVQTSIDEVSGLIETLDNKYYTESEIDSMVSDLNAVVDTKSDANHIHDDVYYTETEIDAKLGEMQSDIDSKVDAVDGMGLSTNDFTTAEKDKLATVEANANFYEHPTHDSHTSGLYKITVDGSGHVSGATLAEKEDIVALGIPSQDTTYDEEISDLSDRIDGIEDGINTTNQTISGVSQEFESYKTTNNEAVSTNASGIEANKTAIEAIQGDYLTSTDRTQLQDSIKQVSDKATANASAIEILNGEGDGSVKQSIDNAFNEFATNISNDGVVNTYKELIDYAAAHGPEFTTLVGEVDTIKTRVGEVETDLSNYKTEVSEQFTEVDTTINNHVTNTNNPHGITKEHIGLDKVDNTSDAEKPISAATQAALDTMQENMNGKADLQHNHDDLYYDKDEILGLITVEDIDDICESNLSSSEDVDLVNVATKYWVEQYYQPKGSYLTETDISNHNTSTSSHNDIRLRIEEIAEDFYTFADCDDETLSQLQEVVNYIKNNASLIEGITTQKVNVSDIIDNLTTNVSDKPLSAAQGVVLKKLIDELSTEGISNVVRYDVAQDLTDEQKEQVRANIGVDNIDVEINEISVQLGTNGAVGGYKTGDVIAAGTDINTILKKLLQKAVAATYTRPTLSLSNNSGTASGNIEAGTSITPKLRASFTKNDAGDLTSIEIMQGGTVVASGTTTPLDYNGSSVVIGDETITFTASADYSDAPVKNNNLGEESKENWFAGSTVTSSSYSITGKRQLFYGTGAGALPTITSDIIRGLSGKKLVPANGNSFNVNVAVGQQYIVIAYPTSLRDVNNITYVEANDSGMASNFTKSTVQVADARGGTNGLVDYKVYTYAMTVPAAAAMTFKVTI